MMLRRIYSTVLVTAGVCLMSPAALAAQLCHRCTDGPFPPIYHHFDECNEGPFLGWWGACQDDYHGDINCDFDHTIVSCYVEARDLAVQVTANLDAGNVEDVLDLMSAEPMVAFNVQRGALQIRGCDGESVVGHIPLPAEFISAFMAADASTVVAQR